MADGPADRVLLIVTGSTLRAEEMDRPLAYYLKQRIEQAASFYPEYCRYYEAQALFQGDVLAWEKWNKLLIRQLKQQQQADGSIPGQFGNDVGTAMSLLSLALNYKFLPIYER